MNKTGNATTERYKPVYRMRSVIAQKAGVSSDYVCRILRGTRAARSEKARRVMTIANGLLDVINNS